MSGSGPSPGDDNPGRRRSPPRPSYAAAAAGYPGRIAELPTDAERHEKPTRTPGLLLGLGLGGFVDGILLHQILQWHHVVSHVEAYPPTTVAGLEANTLADGLFHLATWLFVLAGSLGAIDGWQRRRLAPGWRFHLGLLLVGWGLFNVVEGVINHHLLDIHHVRDDLGAPLSWDIGFLVFGALLIVAGWSMQLAGERNAASHTAGR